MLKSDNKNVYTKFALLVELDTNHIIPNLNIYTT